MAFVHSTHGGMMTQARQTASGGIKQQRMSQNGLRTGSGTLLAQEPID